MERSAGGNPVFESISLSSLQESSYPYSVEKTSCKKYREYQPVIIRQYDTGHKKTQRGEHHAERLVFFPKCRQTIAREATPHCMVSCCLIHWNPISMIFYQYSLMISLFVVAPLYFDLCGLSTYRSCSITPQLSSFRFLSNTMPLTQSVQRSLSVWNISMTFSHT